MLKINYIIDANGRPKVLNVCNTELPSDLAYAKVVDGKIKKREGWNFAFMYCDNIKSFVPPTVVGRYNVVDGQNVRCLIVYDYDKSKNSWSWVCLSIKNIR